MTMAKILMNQQVPEMVIGRNSLEATTRIAATHSLSRSTLLVLNRTAKVDIEVNKYTKRLQLTVLFSTRIRSPMNLNPVREKLYIRRDLTRTGLALKEYLGWLSKPRREGGYGKNLTTNRPAQVTLKNGHPQWELQMVYNQSFDESEFDALEFVASLIGGIWPLYPAN